jgi:hypothetical protein
VVVCAWLDGILGTLWSGENRVALEEDGDGGGVKKFRQDGGEKDETNENNVDGQTVATAAANTSSIFISPV